MLDDDPRAVKNGRDEFRLLVCAAAQVADDAASSKHFGTLRTLSDGQMILLKEIEGLEKQSRGAYEAAGRWLAEKKKLEQQKLE